MNKRDYYNKYPIRLEQNRELLCSNKNDLDSLDCSQLLKLLSLKLDDLNHLGARSNIKKHSKEIIINQVKSDVKKIRLIYQVLKERHQKIYKIYYESFATNTNFTRNKNGGNNNGLENRN